MFNGINYFFVVKRSVITFDCNAGCRRALSEYELNHFLVVDLVELRSSVSGFLRKLLCAGAFKDTLTFKNW